MSEERATTMTTRDLIRKMRDASDEAFRADNVGDCAKASSLNLHIRTVLDAYLIDGGVTESVDRLANEGYGRDAKP